MSDATEDSNKDKGFRINTRGISCIPCRCKKQLYHKETKTITETDKTTTTTVVDKRNMKFGGNGRHQSPDDIFKPEEYRQIGSVEICDTGWNSKENRITPEELEERVEKLETDVDEIKKDINIINTLKSKVD